MQTNGIAKNPKRANVEFAEPLFVPEAIETWTLDDLEDGDLSLYVEDETS
jgi:hypothetical protein